MTPVPTSAQEVSPAFEGSLRLNANNRASGRNYVTWLLLFCIFAFLVRQTVMIRGAAYARATSYDLSAVDTFAGVDIAIVVLAAGVLICTGSLVRMGSAFRRTPVVWLYWYYMICALSFLWSNFPIYSLYRALEFIILLSATLAAVEQFQDLTEAEPAFLRIAAATILLQMCVNLRLGGLSLSLNAWHTNSYSASAAILFCYCLGEYLDMSMAEKSQGTKRAKRLRWFGIFSFGALALGTSATSNIAALVGCLLIFLLVRRVGLLLAGLWIGLLFLVLGRSGEIIQSLIFPGKSEYAIETATGRTLFWEYLWHKFLRSPVLGYGFALITGGHDRILASTTHNSFFTVLIGTGSVGLALFGMFAAKLWWVTIGKVWRGGPGGVGFAGALAAAFVNCLGMPLIADRWVTTTLVFVWLVGFFLLYVRGPRQIASHSGGVPTPEGGSI
jgi:hypothetical protein